MKKQIYMDRFIKACELANSGNAEGALEAYNHVFDPISDHNDIPHEKSSFINKIFSFFKSSENKDGFIESDLRGIVEVYKADCLKGLKRLEEARKAIEKPIVSEYAENFSEKKYLYDYFLIYGSILGGLGDIEGMEDKVMKALHIAASILKDGNKCYYCWATLLNLGKHHSSWDYVIQTANSARVFGLQYGISPLEELARDFVGYAYQKIGIPKIDERAASEKIAMTNANYVFLGGEISWSKSASLSSFLGKEELKDGTIITIKFENRSFQGRLARRLCYWGDEEYLECPFSKDFKKLLTGKHRCSVDVALNRNRQLVMTYTPLEVCHNSSESEKSLLTDAVGTEISEGVENTDSDYLDSIRRCRHPKKSEFKPDPGNSFLERTFVICDTCNIVISKSGACARDACDCSKHSEDYSSAKVCRDW